jgi:hypothetical protein
VVSRILKETSNLLGVAPPLVQDNDNVIQYIVDEQHHSCSNNDSFDYIVTRPGFLKQGPSQKKLAASKSV